MPDRKFSESKTVGTFLPFVYNATLRRSDVLHMAGVSRDLRWHNTRSRHKFTLLYAVCSSGVNSMRKWNMHTRSQSHRWACLCLLSGVPSTVSRQALEQVSTRCGGSGTHQFSISKASRFRSGRSDYRLLFVLQIFMKSTPIFDSIHSTRRTKVKIKHINHHQYKN